MIRETTRWIVYSITLLGCSTDEAPSNTPQGAFHVTTRSAPVSYTVIDSQITPPYKRSLTIRLRRKVSEDTLRMLAQYFYSATPQYQRTFIEYLLPDMVPGAGAWATTHYDPDLEIKIYGSTLDQDALMESRAQATTLPGTMLGEWVDTRPFGLGRIVLARDGAVVHMRAIHQDGSQTTQTLQVARRNGREVFIMPESGFGEYFQIDAPGDLLIFDRDGLMTTAKRDK